MFSNQVENDGDEGPGWVGGGEGEWGIQHQGSGWVSTIYGLHNKRFEYVTKFLPAWSFKLLALGMRKEYSLGHSFLSHWTGQNSNTLIWTSPFGILGTYLQKIHSNHHHGCLLFTDPQSLKLEGTSGGLSAAQPSTSSQRAYAPASNLLGSPSLNSFQLLHDLPSDG